jgi:polyisoprenoid-binding protein YceI
MNRKLFAPVLLAGLALWSGSAAAEVHQFQVDPVHSEVGFKVRHLLAKTPGRFNDFEGRVWMDPEKVEETLKIEGTVQTASVYTANEDRDKHLRSPDFFDVEKHPQMTLVTKSVSKDGDAYRVLADVTMLGVTREVELVVDVAGVMTNPFSGTPTTGLEIEGTVNRKDFGMVWNKALDAGGFILGDDVELEIQLEATVPKPAEG